MVHCVNLPQPHRQDSQQKNSRNEQATFRMKTAFFPNWHSDVLPSSIVSTKRGRTNKKTTKAGSGHRYWPMSTNSRAYACVCMWVCVCEHRLRKSIECVKECIFCFASKVVGMQGFCTVEWKLLFRSVFLVSNKWLFWTEKCVVWW